MQLSSFLYEYAYAYAYASLAGAVLLSFCVLIVYSPLCDGTILFAPFCVLFFQWMIIRLLVYFFYLEMTLISSCLHAFFGLCTSTPSLGSIPSLCSTRSQPLLSIPCIVRSKLIITQVHVHTYRHMRTYRHADNRVDVYSFQGLQESNQQTICGVWRT